MKQVSMILQESNNHSQLLKLTKMNKVQGISSRPFVDFFALQNFCEVKYGLQRVGRRIRKQETILMSVVNNYQIPKKKQKNKI